MFVLCWSSARRRSHWVIAITLFTLISSYGVQSQTEPERILRFANDSNNSGRLEIYHDEEWGTICNDGWSTNEADVACRYLGLGQGKILNVPAGSGQIFLAQVNCQGSEDSILDCQHNNFQGHNCTHESDVGVECDDNDPTSSPTSNTVDDCDFRQGTCSYLFSANSTYKWVRKSGSTSSIGTGPSSDHTGNGYYVYTEASTGSRWSKASMYTPQQNIYIGSLNFWYHMYGSSMGTLNIKLLQNYQQKTVWQRSGNQGNYWQFACIDVHSWVKQVTFEGIRGSSYTGDIAVDDILFFNKKCSEYQMVNCTFESGYCGYEVIRGNGSTYLWSSFSGSYPSPIYDHTTGKSTGKYMAVYPRRSSEGMKSYLLSQAFLVNKMMKVIFYYYMNGDYPGELQVSLRDKSTPLNAWTKHDWQDNGNHGKRWNYGCMDLNPTWGEQSNSSYKRILFTGITGRYSGITLGIDDITVSDGRCETGIDSHMCTFDNEKLCDYTVNCTGPQEFTWRRMKSRTPSSGTGPSSDASKKSDGYYLYTEGSYGKPGDAVSVTFSVKNTAGKYLKYQYHMYGPRMGRLITKYSYGQRSEEITQFTGNQGNTWKSFCRRVNKDIDAVILIAIRGSSFTTDIGVDNVFLDEKPCPNPVNCNFENGMCNYTMVSSSYSYFRWYLYKTTDHTYGNGYALMTRSRYSREGLMTSFRTTNILQNRNRSSLAFHYRTSSLYRGKFMVGVDRPSVFTAVVPSDWKSFSTPYTDWVMGCVDLPENEMVSVNFTAYSSYTSGDYLMVDDIDYAETPCIVGILDEMCTFDEPNICGYNISCRDASDYRWKRGQRTPTYTTGPPSDHTPRGNGYMMYTESTFGAPGDNTKLMFPKFDVPTNNYLSFYYNMYGRDIGTLKVYVITPFEKIMAWQETGETGKSWLKGCAKLPANENVQIVFDGIRGNGPLGDIAIDDVGLEKGICNAQNISCDFSDEILCGYRNGTNYGNNGWIRKRIPTGYAMSVVQISGRHRLRSPIWNLTKSCIKLSYRVIGRYCTLNVFTTHNNKKVLQLGSLNETSFQTAQFYIQHAETALVFEAMTSHTWSSYCTVQIAEVMVSNGACPSLSCPVNTTACTDQKNCVANSKLCDRRNDCLDRSDEMINCPRSISCDFEKPYLCGYNFSYGWYQTDMSKFGHPDLFLDNSVYSMTLNYGNSSLFSPKEFVNKPKCVKFNYAAGRGSHLKVKAHYSSGSIDTLWKNYFSTNTGWTVGQFKLPPGNVQLEFNGYTRSLGLAIDNVELHDGDCPKLVCKDKFFHCPSNEKCIPESNKCDRRDNCKDKSDELNCPTSISCDAEDAYHCGYEYESGNWTVTNGIDNSWPTLDESRGLYSGNYFLSSLSNINKSELRAPEEWLPLDACLSFHYAFIGSGEFEIFDNDVFMLGIKPNNIDAWEKSQVQLKQGWHNISFIHEGGPYTSIGKLDILALDSIEITNGTCRTIVCKEGWSKCPSGPICIPKFKFCDHDDDCPNGEDEKNCQNYNNVRLREGRNVQQGMVEVYYKGNWSSVCGSWYERNAVVTCRGLGYKGTSKTTFKTKRSAYGRSHIRSISCRGYENSLDDCSFSSCYQYCSCYQNAAVDCSDNYCLSTDVPCAPDTSNSTNSTNSNSTTCIPEDVVCDGENDCPGGTDEKSCPTCTSQQFQCLNYDCVPISKRCNGIMDCEDGSDEYRCFKHDIYSMSFMVGDRYIPICENNLMDKDIINKLCHYVGKGSGTSVASQSTGAGVLFQYSAAAKDSVLPGYIRTTSLNCKRLAIKCHERECGTRSPNLIHPVIQHGHKALPGEFPWQVSLHYNSRMNCGGVIIDPRYVLTAAHCVSNWRYPYRYKVYAGSIFQDAGTSYSLNKIIRHQNYSQYGFKNDIALLETKSPIQMTDYVRAVCLPKKPWGPDTEGFLTGWGDDEEGMDPKELLEAKVSLLSNDVCQRSYPNLGEMSFCANHKYPNQPGCYGDSGGPLSIRNQQGYWEVAGLVSYGKPRCKGSQSAPQVLTNVEIFDDWIEENMAY